MVVSSWDPQCMFGFVSQLLSGPEVIFVHPFQKQSPNSLHMIRHRFAHFCLWCHCLRVEPLPKPKMKYVTQITKITNQYHAIQYNSRQPDTFVIKVNKEYINEPKTRSHTRTHIGIKFIKFPFWEWNFICLSLDRAKVWIFSFHSFFVFLLILAFVFTVSNVHFRHWASIKLHIIYSIIKNFNKYFFFFRFGINFSKPIELALFIGQQCKHWIFHLFQLKIKWFAPVFSAWFGAPF